MANVCLILNWTNIPVYTYLLAFSKAVDKVNHLTLCVKMIERQTYLLIVRASLFWYQMQNDYTQCDKVHLHYIPICNCCVWTTSGYDISVLHCLVGCFHFGRW